MSDIQSKILDVLKDGEFHSGETLGEKVGCSRTAVWKHLQKLEAMGLLIETTKGTGYRIIGGVDLLDGQAITGALAVAARPHLSNIHVFQTIDSTNTYARELAEKSSVSGLVILAEQQTAGRGRRGKNWVSPFAANIYLSIVWDFEKGAQALEGLSLAVGVAVRRALIAHGVQGVKLKWPNDIYVEQKKLGGILLEMIGDPAGHCSVVIGVGLNVSMRVSQASAIDQDWTDVATELQDKLPARNKLAAELISEILPLLSTFQAQGFAAYRDEWQAADAFYGQTALISTPKQSIAGIVKGVDINGALRLELDGGNIESFIGGELSLRLAK
ncbi:bifunctional biotin--[acetyl-CoA-carboxylase] ligase/biotin operon repressor BirA [SAR92 clade bacterium H455]|uniref:Bifunctional ligase/repressor BirA n=1 Tax=SAR92 clade bacterium H455 TaxID=2974818 RepID=A0ABY5TMB9_9GAMM|nr:bifunctional biotin--[acetyl-CoA-carboxylase] ligase/biotin operon repressor BirA [SAR92 clade bacterium H455]